MKKLIVCATLALSLACPHPGLTQGTITNVNGASFSLQTIAATATADSTDADLIPFLGPDHVSEQWWWFRLSGDARETPFNSSMPGFSQNYAGQTATLTFNQAGVFNGTMTYFIPSSASNVPGEAIVMTQMRIDNVTGAPLAIVLFNYHDFDVFGAAGDSAVLEAPSSMRIDDAITHTHFGRYQATTSGFYRAGASALGELGLFDATVDNFANDGLPFAPGNYSAGYQWVVTIPVGGDFTASASFALVAIPEPSSLALGAAALAAACLAYRKKCYGYIFWPDSKSLA